MTATLKRADTTIDGGVAGVTVIRSPQRPSLLHRFMTRRRWVFELVLGASIPALLLALWQVAVSREWIDTNLYPGPSSIVQAAWDLWDSGRLMRDLRETMGRILVGFLLGAATGFTVGSAMGLSRIVRSALEPLFNALYVVPKLALLPIFLTVFGFGSAPIIALVAVTSFFYVWIETMESMSSIPEGYIEAARSCGVSRFRMLTHVYIPATLPQTFVSLRIAMNVSVLVTMAGEFVVGNGGIGYLIFSSRQLFIMDWVYAGVVVIAIVGVILATIVTLIGRRLTPWARGSRHTPRRH